MGQVTRTRWGCMQAEFFTDAQVKLWPTTTPVIVTPNVASLPLVPILVAIHFHEYVANYTNIDPTSKILVDVPSGIYAGLGVGFTTTDILAQGASTFGFQPYIAALPVINLTTQFAGAISLHTSNGALGNFTGGDPGNLLHVLVYYVRL